MDAERYDGLTVNEWRQNWHGSVKWGTLTGKAAIPISPP